jgi:NADPH:quinone reductase
MREPIAVVADQLGPPEHYALREHDPGPPAKGDVRIAIKAVGVSYADSLISNGTYQIIPPLPYIPGTECSGIVEAVGDDVDDLEPGSHVVARAFGGLFAQAVNVPRKSVVAIAGNFPFDQAAVLTLSYATAWYALTNRASLRSGETLLVLGAAGGTGYAAVQIGKYLGAHVIASASSKDKRALALAGGADAVVDSRSESWRGDVEAANCGKPINVVFDPVGGTATETAFRCLAWGGRHLVIGFVGGIASLRTNLPLLKGASLVGVDIRQFEIFEPQAYSANLARIFELAAGGVLAPAIAQRFPLREFASAMTAVTKGNSVGRIVLIP